MDKSHLLRNPMRLERLEQIEHEGPRLARVFDRAAANSIASAMAASRSSSTGASTSSEGPHERHDGYTHNDAASEHPVPSFPCTFWMVSGLLHSPWQGHTHHGAHAAFFQASMKDRFDTSASSRQRSSDLRSTRSGRQHLMRSLNVQDTHICTFGPLGPNTQAHRNLVLPS